MNYSQLTSKIKYHNLQIMILDKKYMKTKDKIYLDKINEHAKIIEDLRDEKEKLFTKSDERIIGKRNL